MKPRNRQNRSLTLSSSRWMAYAVAGLATASGGAISVEGAIHYTDPANVKLRYNDQATFPLDDLGDKLVFVHRRHFDHPPAQYWAGFSAVGRVSAAVRGSRIGGTFNFLSNLKQGSLVSQGYLRPYGFGTMAFYSVGSFVEPGIGFIGFAFNNGSGKQYGWARVEMGGGGAGERKNNFKVLDYAYADPGEPIKAGQTSDGPVTGMGSLGLLAAGAVGLTAWRKSRRSFSSAAL